MSAAELMAEVERWNRTVLGTVQISFATRDLMLLHQNKFYWMKNRSEVAELTCTVSLGLEAPRGQKIKSWSWSWSWDPESWSWSRSWQKSRDNFQDPAIL